MTTVDYIEAATAVVLIMIAAWEWRQLARHRHDTALRVLTFGLMGIAFVVTLSTPIAIFEPIHDALDVIEFSNLAWAFIVYCFSVFFLLARAADPSDLLTRNRRAGVEALVLVLAMSVLLLVQKTAPPGTWHSPRIPEDYRTWRNIVFYLAVDGYCLAIWGLGTWRAIAYLRQVNHRWARFAIGLVVAGVTAMVLAVNGVSLLRQGLYIAYPGSKWPALRTVYNSGRLGGQVMLAVGLAAAPMAALLPRFKDRLDQVAKRRYLRQIAPLWARLTAEFPYVVLPGFEQEAGARRGDVRFERMATEITDALAELAPYCSHDSPAGLVEPREAAEVINSALERVRENRSVRWAGGTFEPRNPPYPRLEPDFGDRWREQAHWMIRVGRHLTPPPMPAIARQTKPGDELRAR